MVSVRKCLVAGAVAAFFTTAGAAGQGPCHKDADKLCKDVQPGEGRVLACLKEHKAELSPKCADNLKQVQQQVKQVSAACEPDVEKFCFDTPMGKGGIASCLKKHSEELAPDCKDAVAKAKMAKPKK
jgi:Cysteine rich repeat